MSLPEPDRVTRVRELLRRADDQTKAADNRPVPRIGRDAARATLAEAVAHVELLDDVALRDELFVQIGRRVDDLAWQDADAERGLDGAPPYAPEELPLRQPGPETLAAPIRRSGPDRLPPNQRLLTTWPLLHVGRVPHTDLRAWHLTLSGLVEGHRRRWTWDEFTALPTVEVTADFHCVTGWSRYDNRWTGVRFRDLAERAGVRDTATHVIVNGEGAYSANLDLATMLRDDVLLATHHDGAPLSDPHGGPLRLVVPSRYAWKSVKWVRSLQLLDRDVPGYWEARGYHNVGDPFLEQRYA